MRGTIIRMNRRTIVFILAVVITTIGFTGCEKIDIWKDHHNDRSGKPTSYSAEVLEKWMALQVRLMRNYSGVPNHAYSRPFAYSGIAAWESLAPGMPHYVQLKDKWNGLTGLPQVEQRKKYYWPANVNAALASMNRALFPNAIATDKAAIDSLEQALNQHFATKVEQSVLTRSAAFGKAVAAAVFNWSETDGSKATYPPYVPPVGDGQWKSTNPDNPNALPLTPYWGKNRPAMKGSISNTKPAAPPAYSTDPNSTFYKMVKQVKDASDNATPDQRAMAFFWRDVPGVTSPGHWVSVLLQIVHKTDCSLAKGAFAYALAGTALNDALIACFQAKYEFNLLRPYTYVREVMNDAGWNPVLGTPMHPEYPSAHASLSSATGEALYKIFGHIGSITDHTYDYLGFAPRTYSSVIAVGVEAGQSRLPAGIHYQQSIDAGLWQGKKVAWNMFNNCPQIEK